MPVLQLRDVKANFSRYRVGEPVPTLTDAQMPTQNQKNHKYLASALLPAIAPKLRSSVIANLVSGIHHFSDASAIFVNEHTVNVGNGNYGGAYEDEFGVDENKMSGPFLMWKGQLSSDASAGIHSPLLQPGRRIFLFLRSRSASSFYFWGELKNATLIRDGTPPVVKYTISSFAQLQHLGFPGSINKLPVPRLCFNPPVPQAPANVARPRPPVQVQRPRPASEEPAARRPRRGEPIADEVLPVPAWSPNDKVDAKFNGQGGGTRWYPAVVVSFDQRASVSGKYTVKYDEVHDVDGKYTNIEPNVLPKFIRARQLLPPQPPPPPPQEPVPAPEEPEPRPPAPRRREPPQRSSPRIAAQEAEPTPTTERARGKRKAEDRSDDDKDDDEDENECVVCHDGERTHAMIPCGHRYLCGKCARKFKRGKNKGNGFESTCSICRAEWTDIIPLPRGFKVHNV